MKSITKILTLAIGLLAVCTACVHHDKHSSGFTISWTNNLLTVRHPKIPGGTLEVWYLEAFCRSNAHGQSWDKTKIPHQTKLLRADDSGKLLEFLTQIEPSVTLNHRIQVNGDKIDFTYEFENRGNDFADIQWFQPACVRVGDFCRADQQNFITHCFVFTSGGMTSLEQTERTTEALYRGGQVFLPEYVPISEANPRPVAGKRVSSGIIGCVSYDRSQALLLSSSTTHELFEGVYRCIHSDPRIGGLKPFEKKRITGWIRLMPNETSRIRALAARHPAKDSSD